MIKAIQKSISKIIEKNITHKQTKTILAVISVIDHQHQIKIPNEEIISNGITPGAPFYDIVQNVHGFIESVDISTSHNMSYPIEHIITIRLHSNEMIKI